MYIYIGYEVEYDFCIFWRTVAVVFADRERAEEWAADKKPTETNWREYEFRKVQ